MGQVKVPIKVVNLLKPERSVEAEAIVDMGCTLLALPRNMIEKLELPFVRTASTRTTNGIVERRVFEAAKLFIKDRTAMVDVVELTDDLPPLNRCCPPRGYGLRRLS